MPLTRNERIRRDDGCAVRMLADELPGTVLHDIFSTSIRSGKAGIGITVGVSGNNDGNVEISVTGTGRKIPDDTKGRTFDRFLIDPDKRGRYGPGLYIVKLIIGAYAGRVWAKDRVCATRNGVPQSALPLKARSPPVFPYPVLFQPACKIDHDPYLLSSGKGTHAIIIDLLYMPEFVFEKIFLYKGQKCDLLFYAGGLILHGHLGCPPALVSRYLRMVLPVLVQPGKLAPVHVSLFIRFTVEHVRVNAAYEKTPFVYPAPVVIKKITGPGLIVFCLQGIPRHIERAVLVAEFREGGRFNRPGIDLPRNCGVLVEKKDMTIESPGAAPAAEITPEPHLSNNRCQALCGI